jgi:Arc/MetJ family transcription regulator
MRTTINIDEKLLGEASRLTGITEKTSLVRMGLEALVRREAAKRLAAMGGTDSLADAGPRKRPCLEERDDPRRFFDLDQSSSLSSHATNV